MFVGLPAGCSRTEMSKLFLAYQNAALNKQCGEPKSRQQKLRNAQTSAQELTKTSGSMLHASFEKASSSLGWTILARSLQPKVQQSAMLLPLGSGTSSCFLHGFTT